MKEPNDPVEEHVVEYLRTEKDDGSEADRDARLRAYLGEIPEEVREECERRIRTACDLGPLLRSLAPAGPRDGSPSLPDIAGFALEKELGEGGLGTVYLAEDQALRRRVAIKALKRGTGQTVRDHILSEAQNAARVVHPAIVTIHSVIPEGEHPAIVMEYVDGQPIDKISRGLDARAKARLLKTVAEGLSQAHASSVVHCDLKPANVLVATGMRPKILDFGLAASTLERPPETTAFQGTPLYCSPEQAKRIPVTPKTDVFSFGSLMFTVLCGAPPFAGETSEDILERIISDDPPFLRDLACDIPEELQAITLACLAKDPKERPTADEVARDLGRYLAREPIQLRPALYGDVLHKKIAHHTADLKRWEHQGMISRREGDRLQTVYRRILDDEDHWILDARKISAAKTILYLGTWITVFAAILLVWIVRDDISPLIRWAAPVTASAGLLGIGLLAQRRRESLAAASLLAGAVLSIVPTVLSALGELGLLSDRDPEISQLLGEPFSNPQILVASLAGLLLSCFCLARLRLPGFAWTTAILTCTAYLSSLLLFGWLDEEPEVQALWCLPLVCLEGLALVLERRGRVRWSQPFHLIALITLIATMDTIAISGPTLVLLGVETAIPSGGLQPYLVEDRLQAFSVALNGLLFIGIVATIERSKSLDLRRAAGVLETIAPLHLLSALYFNVRLQGVESGATWTDLSLYFAGVAGVLILSPWRSRRGFLFAGLGATALGSHLLVDLDLVPHAPFVLGLGVVGLVTALGMASLRLRRPSKKAPLVAPPE